mmetsp:Transcript_4536/g.6795  ORF Transcript_4536/g.6795 Transcript_4536/m.6795 type:complete len:414 (-) Transcript_4536:33-1274(-)|eukprot:6148169-Ditylum_brightwellii.AAC.1
MAGVDLNRRWDKPDPMYHPTIYHTKEMVRRLQACREVVTVCDIHGHNRKEGLFMYGCVPSTMYQTNSIKTTTSSDKNLSKSITASTFPEIFDRESEYFQFTGCSFKMQKCKSPTMRMVMFEEMDIKCSYTLEASHSGVNGHHFSRTDLEKMGTQYCLSLLKLYGYIEDINDAKVIAQESRLCYSSLVGKNASSKNSGGGSSSSGGALYDRIYAPPIVIEKELSIISCQPRKQQENARQNVPSFAEVPTTEISEVSCMSTYPFKLSNTSHHKSHHSPINTWSNDSGGSDSNPSDDNMTEKEAMTLLSGAKGKGKQRKRKKKKNKRVRQGSSFRRSSIINSKQQSITINAVLQVKQKQLQHGQQSKFKPFIEEKVSSSSFPSLRTATTNKYVTSWSMDATDALENIIPLKGHNGH